MDVQRLRRARGDLMRAGLIAWARPVYQVLALDMPPIRSAPATSLPPVPAAASHIDDDEIRARIAGLRAAVSKRP